ncbi:MAG: hypothetical protein MJ137_00090 [Clostridia bacterium]|nr:hypothetical protein [Clostridia bacterium]
MFEKTTILSVPYIINQMSVILYLEENPWIQTYQLRNFELGVLQCKSPWIFGQYINCYYDPNAKKKFCHYMPDGRYFQKCGATLVNRFEYDRISGVSSSEIIDFTISHLDNGWYVVGFVDEYHIPNTDSYLVKHHRHSILLYGYDEATAAFIAIGYTRGKQYLSHPIPYECFVSAVIGRRFSLEKKQTISYEKIELEAFKINPEYHFELNLNELYTSLDNYLESVSVTQDEKRFGIDCERAFCEYIVSPENAFLDERYSRFFLDLKRIMYYRLMFLKSENIITQNLVDQFATVLDDQEIVHNLFLKSHFSIDDKVKQAAFSRMIRIINNEYCVLGCVREAIASFFN